MSSVGAGPRGRVAAVLDAASPWGEAAARRLAASGVRVVLGGRSRERLAALEGEIGGGRAVAVGVHPAKRHHLEHLVEAAVEEFGGLDLLLFAARASAPPLSRLDAGALERSVDVNFRGLVYALAAALPALRGRGGTFVYLCAGPEEPDPLYEAARAAAGSLLRAAGSELGGEGVRFCELVAGGGADGERAAGEVLRLLREPGGGGFLRRVCGAA
ncbi:NAD dependent epimerase/dehydratase family [Rubrobacter xylanophilus DSM 9941]|uniref:NAD dependent epimerase/dehydratase family n=1 Tax=Rubrobacter xylanophilus (strain DSM 9941 / JCM 11954 / NBRC 16129 / PRD-1) TaxID=266117 RepID=Q1AWQ3_RUBXD|nr:NAD dependent epimerase/dehydratase family [Rubrobacter xylanophilus DSM 9941]